MNLSKVQIHEILQKYLQNLIKKYDQPAKYDRELQEHEFHSWGSDKDAVEGTIDVLNEIKAECNVKVHSGDYSEVEHTTAKASLNHSMDSTTLQKELAL